MRDPTAASRFGQGTVTAISPQRRNGGRRFNVYVDGRFAFSVSPTLAPSLSVGDPVDTELLASVVSRDELSRCTAAAQRFLAARPRSEREVRDRLGRHGYSVDAIADTMRRLTVAGLLDDAAFATYWVEQREANRPRGARLLKLELRQKGVDRDLVEDAVGQVTEPNSAAMRAARPRLRTLRGLDRATFGRRLGGFLARRGFDYDAISATTSLLWDEMSGARTGDDTD